MSQSRAPHSQGSEATSANRGGFFKPEFNYEGRTHFCHCGVVSPRIMAWTEPNAGRRFYGCRYWRTEDECIFFEWHDGEIVGRAHDVIWNLKEENEWLKSQLKNVPRGHGNRGNLSHVENEIQNLRADLRGINVEGSIEKVRADLREMDFTRCIEKLRTDLMGMDCRIQAMEAIASDICVEVEHSVNRLIKKFLMNLLAIVLVIVVFVFGQL